MNEEIKLSMMSIARDLGRRWGEVPPFHGDDVVEEVIARPAAFDKHYKAHCDFVGSRVTSLLGALRLKYGREASIKIAFEFSSESTAMSLSGLHESLRRNQRLLSAIVTANEYFVRASLVAPEQDDYWRVICNAYPTVGIPCGFNAITKRLTVFRPII